MGLIKNIKKQFIAFVVLSIVAVNLSSCVYANNKDWDELSSIEKEEIR